MSKHPYLHRTLIALFAVATLVVALVLGHAIVVTRTEPMWTEDHTLSYCTDGWAIETDGAPIPTTLSESFPTDADSVTITRTITPEETRYVLLFENQRQAVRITAMDKLLYEINQTELTDFLLVTSNNLVHLPDSDQPYELRITFSHFTGGVCKLPGIYMGFHYSALMHLLRSDLPTIISIVLLVVFGLFLMVAAVIFRANHFADPRLALLSIFMLSLAVWGFTDSSLFLLTPMKPDFSGILNYYALMVLPIPISGFVLFTCRHHGRVLPIMMLVGFLNILIQTALSLHPSLRLNDTLLATHALIAATVVVGTIETWREMRHPDCGSGPKYLFVGFACMLVLITVSVLAYWNYSGSLYRNFMMSGICLFYLELLSILIMAYGEAIQKSKLELAQLEIYKQVSLTDNLTDLGNRRAFEQKLLEISSMPDVVDAVLVMMDLNGLKYANDNYGHNAGDELIITAAHCIRSIFGEAGTCYRIGGDEFTAVIVNPTRSMESFDDAMSAWITHYNQSATYKLSIARGISHLRNSAGHRLSISNWKQEADVNMYIDKTSNRLARPVDRSRELQDIIECIIATVEAKDMYTADHSNRVRELSMLISDKLGLSSATQDEIEIAAELHDIGKIGVPDYILTKPGKLSDEEAQLMRQHPVIGSRIVSRAASMENVSKIILYHHERYDGLGYPDRISHEDIPIGSRIIALADSIDAMTSTRCYRDALTLDQCRGEVEKNLGTMYDPAIGQIALDHWSEIEHIVLMHPKDLLPKNPEDLQLPNQ